MRSDGTHSTQLTFQPIAHDQLPDWSPNGRAIAYTQGDIGTNEKIWVMSADGLHQRQVSHGSDDDFGAAWSPDGRSIAFLRAYPDGDRPVMVMNADGTNARPVHDPDANTKQYVPAWQPLNTGRS